MLMILSGRRYRRDPRRPAELDSLADYGPGCQRRTPERLSGRGRAAENGGFRDLGRSRGGLGAGAGCRGAGCRGAGCRGAGSGGGRTGWRTTRTTRPSRPRA
ncbi:hypothetical protein LA76x_1872 [Lysobacter antibioticus]|uniref:Uncharacterized protein n=1 Tax=Lysobacter antibioticus TaxID=84531 RepID=A0A0S2F958_LYSAN|nr:hypothetical protein LA76x_1872 [Lysobacter antibioticus]